MISSQITIFASSIIPGFIYIYIYIVRKYYHSSLVVVAAILYLDLIRLIVRIIIYLLTSYKF